MEKLKNLRTYLMIILTLNVFSQDFSKKNDSIKLNLLEVDKESFSVEYDKKELLSFNLWDETRIGVLYVKIGGNLFNKLTFSYNRILISKKEVKLVNGKYVEHGISYQFNDKGTLNQLYSYKDGILDGIYISYFDNGSINVRGKYLNGEKNGIWEFFNLKGILVRKEKK
jgi:antitoxin component YwqK of YwqJK toxin-antitoxin module